MLKVEVVKSANKMPWILLNPTETWCIRLSFDMSTCKVLLIVNVVGLQLVLPTYGGLRQ